MGYQTTCHAINTTLHFHGYFADVVIFDPATIADKATFADPFQYAVGVQHVLIKGKLVLKDGNHTGVLPGRAIWGPGRKSKTL